MLEWTRRTAMSRFGSNPQEFFDSVYQNTPPWDVGGPQPALVELAAVYPPEGPALDVGCGAGDHVFWLAQLGLPALGIDFVEAAVLQARQKAQTAPGGGGGVPEFLVADGLRPRLLGRNFRTVVDSGFYHLFDPAAGEAYLDELTQVLLPGGRLYLLAFAVEFAIPNSPRGITEEELRSRFTADRGWRLLDLRPAQFQNRIAPVPAVAACVERLVETEKR